jgi:hypothetical protein
MSDNLNEIRRYDDEEMRKIRQINEGLRNQHGFLQKLDERVIYDKAFLLEVQAAGYNPMDPEDVHNYENNLPSKYEERNMKLCGADQYKYLGQGEYEEDELKKVQKKHGIEVNLKKAEDFYASDFRGEQRKILMEKAPEIDINTSGIELDPDDIVTYKNLDEAENLLRKNMAKAFGSESMNIQRKDIPKESKQLARTDDKIDKTLELIKELRALGFTPEEIKEELKLRYR